MSKVPSREHQSFVRAKTWRESSKTLNSTETLGFEGFFVLFCPTKEGGLEVINTIIYRVRNPKQFFFAGASKVVVVGRRWKKGSNAEERYARVSRRVVVVVQRERERERLIKREKKREKGNETTKARRV